MNFFTYAVALYVFLVICTLYVYVKHYKQNFWDSLIIAYFAILIPYLGPLAMLFQHYVLGNLGKAEKLNQ